MPVPEFVAPTESRGGVAGEGEYPLEFLPRKADNYMNSTFANMPGHQRMEAQTDGGAGDACGGCGRRGGSLTGDAVEVFNARGSDCGCGRR